MNSGMNKKVFSLKMVWVSLLVCAVLPPHGLFAAGSDNMSASLYPPDQLVQVTSDNAAVQTPLANPDMDYLPYTPNPGDRVLSRRDYVNRLYGFWLGQCIANWTGLVTEMDKIGGEGPRGRFYTRNDWGKPDQPNIWSEAHRLFWLPDKTP